MEKALLSQLLAAVMKSNIRNFIVSEYMDHKINNMERITTYEPDKEAQLQLKQSKI